MSSPGLQEVRLSSAVAFGTSEEHLRGLKFLTFCTPASDLQETRCTRCEVGDPGFNVHGRSPHHKEGACARFQF